MSDAGGGGPAVYVGKVDVICRAWMSRSFIAAAATRQC
jgi:hypothetical protein